MLVGRFIPVMIISVRQRFHESNKSGFLFRSQSQVTQFIFIHRSRIFGWWKFITYVTYIIEMYNLFKCFKIPVVSVWRCQFHITKRRYTKLSVLLRLSDNSSQSKVYRVRSQQKILPRNTLMRVFGIFRNTQIIISMVSKQRTAGNNIPFQNMALGTKPFTFKKIKSQFLLCSKRIVPFLYASNLEEKGFTSFEDWYAANASVI